MISVSASLASTDRIRRRVENKLSSLNRLSLPQPSVLCTHLHSYILVFHIHDGDGALHTAAVGTEGRYLVVLVDVVGLARLGLGVLIVA